MSTTPPTNLTADVAALVEQHIDGTQFQSADDVIRAALVLLEGYQARYREKLHADLQQAVAELERGDVVTVDDSGLQTLFDDIEQRGRERFQARQT